MTLLIEMPRTKRVFVESLVKKLYRSYKIVWDLDLLNKNVIKSYNSENSDSQQIFNRGEIANAESALPTWTFEADELFE